MRNRCRAWVQTTDAYFDRYLVNANAPVYDFPGLDFGNFQAVSLVNSPGTAVLSGVAEAPIATPLPAGAAAVLQYVTGFTISNLAPGGSATVVIHLPGNPLIPGMPYNLLQIRCTQHASVGSGQPWCRHALMQALKR